MSLLVVAVAGCRGHRAEAPPRPTTLPIDVSAVLFPVRRELGTIVDARRFRHACRIPRGGPGPGFTLRGSCRTQLFPAGDVTRVVFTQWWNARDFREAHSRRTGTLHHRWELSVVGGKIVERRQSGDFPPQYVR